MADLVEGVLLLSEAILESNDYSRQHTEVAQHMIKLIAAITKSHKKASSIVDTATHILKARYSDIASPPCLSRRREG